MTTLVESPSDSGGLSVSTTRVDGVFRRVLRNYLKRPEAIEDLSRHRARKSRGEKSPRSKGKKNSSASPAPLPMMAHLAMDRKRATTYRLLCRLMTYHRDLLGEIQPSADGGSSECIPSACGTCNRTNMVVQDLLNGEWRDDFDGMIVFHAMELLLSRETRPFVPFNMFDQLLRTVDETSDSSRIASQQNLLLHLNEPSRVAFGSVIGCLHVFSSRLSMDHSATEIAARFAPYIVWPSSSIGAEYIFINLKRGQVIQSLIEDYDQVFSLGERAAPLGYGGPSLDIALLTAHQGDPIACNPVGATVKLGSYRGEPCVIKICSFTMPHMSENVTQEERDALFEEFRREVSALTVASHPNIVRMLAVDYSRTQLVLEYCAQGSLHALYTKSPESLTVKRSLFILRDVVNGMIYLHSVLGLIHRDLKSPNILLDSDGKAKVADFGSSVKIRRNRMRRQRSMTSAVGTQRWMAPEMRTKSYTPAVDVFSFGILMWECFAKQLPFSDARFTFEVEDRIRGGHRPPIDPSWPSSLQILIAQCWAQDPLRRPTFEAIYRLIDESLPQEPPPTTKPNHDESHDDENNVKTKELAEGEVDDSGDSGDIIPGVKRRNRTRKLGVPGKKKAATLRRVKKTIAAGEPSSTSSSPAPERFVPLSTLDEDEVLKYKERARLAYQSERALEKLDSMNITEYKKKAKKVYAQESALEAKEHARYRRALGAEIPGPIAPSRKESHVNDNPSESTTPSDVVLALFDNLSDIGLEPSPPARDRTVTEFTKMVPDGDVVHSNSMHDWHASEFTPGPCLGCDVTTKMVTEGWICLGCFAVVLHKDCRDRCDAQVCPKNGMQMAKALSLGVGDRAPSWSLPDSRGNIVSLDPILASGASVVLFFFPSADANSSVCRMMNNMFADHHLLFKYAKCRLIGISGSSCETLCEFSNDLDLPFTLLADTQGTVRQMYNVTRNLKCRVTSDRVRSTYVISPEGVILQRFASLKDPMEHVVEALATVSQLLASSRMDAKASPSEIASERKSEKASSEEVKSYSSSSTHSPSSPADVHDAGESSNRHQGVEESSIRQELDDDKEATPAESTKVSELSRISTFDLKSDDIRDALGSIRKSSPRPSRTKDVGADGSVDSSPSVAKQTWTRSSSSTSGERSRLRPLSGSYARKHSYAQRRPLLSQHHVDGVTHDGNDAELHDAVVTSEAPLKSIDVLLGSLLSAVDDAQHHLDRMETQSASAKQLGKAHATVRTLVESLAEQYRKTTSETPTTPTRSEIDGTQEFHA